MQMRRRGLPPEDRQRTNALSLFQKGSIIVALGAGAPAFFVRNIVEDHLDWVRLGIRVSGVEAQAKKRGEVQGLRYLLANRR